MHRERPVSHEDQSEGLHRDDPDQHAGAVGLQEAVRPIGPCKGEQLDRDVVELWPGDQPVLVGIAVQQDLYGLLVRGAPDLYTCVSAWPPGESARMAVGTR